MKGYQQPIKSFTQAGAGINIFMANECFKREFVVLYKWNLDLRLGLFEVLFSLTCSSLLLP